MNKKTKSNYRVCTNVCIKMYNTTTSRATGAIKHNLTLKHPMEYWFIARNSCATAHTACGCIMLSDYKGRFVSVARERCAFNMNQALWMNFYIIFIHLHAWIRCTTTKMQKTRLKTIQYNLFWKMFEGCTRSFGTKSTGRSGNLTETSRKAP